MSSRYYLGYPALVLSVVLLGSGCQGEQPYGEVEGVITLDGQPLTDVEVVFMPDPEKGTKGKRSVALADKDGRFRIASDAGRAGAPVGFHRVIINDLLLTPPGVGLPSLPDDEGKGPVGTRPEDAAPRPGKQSRFPVEYSNPVETPLTGIEVKGGTQVIALPLKRSLSK